MADITLEDFKRAVADFVKEVATLDAHELEAARAALAGLYLRVELKDIESAAMHLRFALRRYCERDTILTFGYNPMQRLKEMLT
jgi:hypothetical protein